MLFIAGVLAAPIARASDHLDTPTVIADPAADIGDLYAWTSSDGRQLNLAMNIVGGKFSDRIQYVFHVDSGKHFGKTSATTSIMCRFDDIDSDADGPSCGELCYASHHNWPEWLLVSNQEISTNLNAAVAVVISRERTRLITKHPNAANFLGTCRIRRAEGFARVSGKAQSDSRNGQRQHCSRNSHVHSVLHDIDV